MTDNKPTINIRDFTIYPTARYVTDGPKSAEEFFITQLDPFLNEHTDDEIIIDFDGTWGFASSFKNELAVRLAEKYPDIDADTLRKRVQLISDDEPGLIERFWKEYTEKTRTNEMEK